MFLLTGIYQTKAIAGKGIGLETFDILLKEGQIYIAVVITVLNAQFNIRGQFWISSSSDSCIVGVD